MQGRYIGQFLPTSGGSMSGTLNLDGQLLSGAGVIADTQGNAMLTIVPGDDVQLLSNYGLAFDNSDNAYVYGDGSGNTTFQFENASFNGNNIGIIAGGSHALTLSGGTVTLSGSLVTTTSPITTSNSIVSTSSVQASEVITPSLSLTNFTANQIIYVDGTNGSLSGFGTSVSPYKTVTKACSVAASGTLIFVAPGIYTGDFTLPSGVALVGSGRGVTTLYDTSGVVLSISKAPYVANLTIDSGNASDTSFATCVAISPGTSGTVGGTFENVDFYCAEDGVLLNASGATGGSLLFRNCNWFTACWSIYDEIGLSIDAYDCNWTYYTFTNRPGGSPQISAVTCAASNSIFRAFGGNVTVNYTGTATNFIANAAVVVPGLTNSNAQFIGTNISFNCPNIPSTAISVPFIQDGSGSATVFVGPGTVFSGTYQTSTTNGLLPNSQPTLAIPGATTTLAVSSSAITPALVMNNVQNEVATDAGSLSSNTLTVNAPSPGAPSDGLTLKLRIKNTNSGSTAMTLSLNSSYNVGATSVATIAAGKRAYLTFVYDADNSKWDLTNYVNGL